MAPLVVLGPGHAAAEAKRPRGRDPPPGLFLATGAAEVGPTPALIVAERVGVVEAIGPLDAAVGTDVPEGDAADAGVAGGSM